jgi:hypothetical protein
MESIPPPASKTAKAIYGCKMVRSFVSTSTRPADAGGLAITLTVTSAQFAVTPLTTMELRSSLAAREHDPCTPYIAEAWE